MEAQNPMSTLFIFVIFGLIFYFMIYRPQAKRNKEHKKLMSELAKGTEVLTAGGLIGKITKVTEGSDSIVIALNDTTEITINRNYIVSVLPKGSIVALCVRKEKENYVKPLSIMEEFDGYFYCGHRDFIFSSKYLW